MRTPKERTTDKRTSMLARGSAEEPQEMEQVACYFALPVPTHTSEHQLTRTLLPSPAETERWRFWSNRIAHRALASGNSSYLAKDPINQTACAEPKQQDNYPIQSVQVWFRQNTRRHHRRFDKIAAFHVGLLRQLVHTNSPAQGGPRHFKSGNISHFREFARNSCTIRNLLNWPARLNCGIAA